MSAVANPANPVLGRLATPSYVHQSLPRFLPALVILRPPDPCQSWITDELTPFRDGSRSEELRWKTGGVGVLQN
jgi:hypothetical protein